MRMQHGLNIRPYFINMLMEGQLNRRRMDTYNCTVRLYLHDILPGQGTFVNTAGSYPDIPVIVHYGQISSRSSG